MVAVVAQEDLDHVQKLLESAGETTFRIGEIEKHSHQTQSWEKGEDAVVLSGKLAFKDFPGYQLHKKVG